MSEAITIFLRNHADVVRTRPVSIGIPFPRGSLDALERLSLVDEAGLPVAVQARTLLTWPDGSPQWVLVDFLPRLAPMAKTVYRLRVGESLPPAPDVQVQVEETPERVTVRNGRLVLALSRQHFRLCESLTLDGVPVLKEGTGDLFAVGSKGLRCYASQDRAFQVEVEEAGPVKAVLKVSGTHLAYGGRRRLLDFGLRYHVFAGCPALLLQHEFCNRQPPEEGVEVESFSMRLATAVGEDVFRLIHFQGFGDWVPGRFVRVPENVAIRAEPGAYFAQIENLDSIGLDYAAIPFYMNTPGWDKLSKGVLPYVHLSDGRIGATVFFLEMLPNHPKELASDGDEIEFSFWPACAGPLRLTRGMSKRHRMVLAFHAGEASPEEVEATYVDWEHPLDATISPAYYRECEVADVHRLFPYQPLRYPRLEENIHRLFQIAWPTGMKDWGDCTAWGATPQRATSFINNEGDFIKAAMAQYLRTGDSDYFRTAARAARHLIDIDFVDSSEDPLREGAVVSHSPEHTLGVVWPSHMWVEGLLTYYAASGDADAFRVAIAIGDNLIRWLDQAPHVVFSTARETGYPLLALSALYEATREDRFRQAAARLVEGYRKLLKEEGGLYYPVEHSKVPYAEYIAPRALYRYWLATGDEHVRPLALDLLEWMFKECLGPDGVHRPHGFPDTFPFFLAYTLTGDERYIHMGRPTLAKFLADVSPSHRDSGSAAFLLNLNLHYLSLADAFGLIDDSLPRPTAGTRQPDAR